MLEGIAMCKFLLKKKKLFVAAYMIITLSMVCNLSVVRPSQGSDGALTETDELLQELKELGVKRYGVQTGTIYDQDIMKLIPDAQLEYYNFISDLIVALRAGKIDAFPVDSGALIMMEDEITDFKVLEPYMDHYSCGFAFPKTSEGEKHRDEMDEWLAKAKENGTYGEIKDKWFQADGQSKAMPDYEDIPATNGTLIFATEAGYPPFDYIQAGEIVGFEVEMAVEYCKDYGYGIKIVPINFDGILPAMQAGKVDFAASGFSITEERKESVYFSESYYDGGTKMVVKGTENSGGKSFSGSIAESFEKTFIREERWKMFAQGSINTLLITVFSMLFGTLLGFLGYMLCRSRGIVVNTMASWFMWLLQGMPVVVLLMILYYVIFGSISSSGLIVSIVGFTLIFAVAVFGILKNGVAAVDIGQTEAATALGCTPRRAFFQIILPQALPFMTDPFKGEVTALIKATSIVGYIAVLDLAKMGDLVRSRTYEAFFPLIAVMFIYFILEIFFGLVLKVIANRIDPKKKKVGSLLKGVDLHD